MSTTPTARLPDPSRTCPACPSPVGQPHLHTCAVYYEVISVAGRPKPYDVVQETDLAATSCGCSQVLVRARDEHGHRPGCPRAAWITALDPPPDQDLAAGWRAAYADHDDRRQVPLDATVGGFRTAGPFTTWDLAAAWLDALATRDRAVRPLGVFADSDPLGVFANPAPVRSRLPVLAGTDPGEPGALCPTCLHPWWSHPRPGNQHGCVGTGCRCDRLSAPSGMAEAPPVDVSLRSAVRAALRDGSRDGAGLTVGQVSHWLWIRTQTWGPQQQWWEEVQRSHEPLIAELDAAVVDEVATYQPPKANRAPRWLWKQPADGAR